MLVGFVLALGFGVESRMVARFVGTCACLFEVFEIQVFGVLVTVLHVADPSQLDPFIQLGGDARVLSATPFHFQTLTQLCCSRSPLCNPQFITISLCTLS